MKLNGEKYRFWLQAFSLKWFLISFLIPSLCFGQEVKTMDKPTYLCTSRQYQMSFGSSMQCPNIESKVKRELMSYLIWSYRNLGGLRAARDAYKTFSCRWVEGL